MIEMIAALQPLVVGAVLLWSARVKLLSRHAAAVAGRSALVNLLGERRALPAYRLVGGVELTLGGLLVLPPALRAEAAAAAVLAAGFLAYLGYARRAAPTSSCGCLSARATPVSHRGIARAGLLLAASGLAALAPGGWLAALTARPFAGTAVLLVELAAIVALSPELDRAWLLPLRQLRMRLTHPLRGNSGVPLLATVQQLQLSDAYRRVAPLLRSDVREHWDDGDWRFVGHAARYQGRAATAVFAVPLADPEPAAVRVAVVDDTTGHTLLSLAGTPPAAGPHLAVSPA
ncbi:MauE/DoxX family redox-associated membrane protein [Micromonospora globbae]|uniref:Methylamine utilisation protein MauE domain-containing protein n=1 Tax=Micromonospora globbae TaxID=1894969 RepID=A0ABZ1SH81_9ACTN|nr:MauE/DoxX family redox-associated membrane protein [Micromonospora globbae]